MVTSLGATLLGPGRVRHAGHGPTVLGTHARGPGRAAVLASLGELAAAMGRAGMPCRVLGTAGELDRALWTKLAVNAAINPLTAAHGVPNGAVLSDPALRAWARAICGEVCRVAALSGRADLDPAATWAAVERAATLTADNRSSMLQDLVSAPADPPPPPDAPGPPPRPGPRRARAPAAPGPPPRPGPGDPPRAPRPPQEAGRETEIEAISGAVVRAAAEAGAPPGAVEANVRAMRAVARAQARGGGRGG